MGDNVVGLVVVVLIFGGGTISYAIKSMVRLAELKLQQSAAGKNQNGATVQAVAELRAEVAALRDTSTRYDVSLDSALTRLESRVDTLETKRETVGVPVGSQVTIPTPTPTAQQTVGGRNG